jgi:hypothetical protein
MGKYDGPEYRIINEIIAADEQRERLKAPLFYES